MRIVVIMRAALGLGLVSGSAMGQTRIDVFGTLSNIFDDRRTSRLVLGGQSLSAERGAFGGLVVPTVKSPSNSADAPTVSWTMPLMEWELSASEKATDLSPTLVEAIIRIEGLYDPTRLDETGLRPPQQIGPGTASMNNVFADRWHVGDTDANVGYRVHYIAQAWQKGSEESCKAFDKHRPGFGIVELTTMSNADCARVESLHGPQTDLIEHLFVAAAPMSLPVFVAPEPGLRLSPEAFWAVQKARMEAIRARIAFRRLGLPTHVASKP